MQIKYQSIETVEESKAVVETPKNQMIPFHTKKITKRFSSLEYTNRSEPLWHESSLTMTRDRSPSHKIPNAIRFAQFKSKQFVTVNLSKDISNPNKGIGFPKSSRPEHFIKRLNLDFPSSANYNLIRFLDQQEDINPSQIPQKTKSSFHKTQSTLRGVTIPAFSSYSKSYIAHSKHKPYQPQNTLQNPGPGHYNHSFENKRKSFSYSLRKRLKRFNQQNNHHPGVASYNLATSQTNTLSINAKNTIPKSLRTYLTKLDQNPSPHDYNISRFLQSAN